MSGIQNLVMGGSAAGSAAEDSSFEYVTALLPGNGTSGAQNNTFLDSSSNAFTVTRSGNPSQGSFSPFSRPDGSWSNFFDGTGDYLLVSHIAGFSPNTYVSLECFVYFTNLPAAALIVGRQGMWLSYSYTAIGGSANKIAFSLYDGAWNTANSTSTINLNQWYHIVGVRDNTTLRIYINGVQEGTASFTGTPTSYSTDFAIGGLFTGGDYVTGYISNVRYCNGSTSGALPYTGTPFTVPTSSLTATTDTVLLTCQSNRFKDNSTNNSTITVNGDTSVQVFNPFEPTAAWSASTNGGSGFFDGSSDVLSIADNADLDFGSGDFTVEGWFYANTNANYVVSKYEAGSQSSYLVGFANATTWEVTVYSTSGSNGFTGTAPARRQWVHFALERNGSNNEFYVNGSRVWQTSAITVRDSTAALAVGNLGSGYSNFFDGYISNVRIVKGSAVYSGSTYTVPTAPFTAITNTKLLLNFTNAGIYDASAMSNFETAGGAQISTAQSKFGGSSMYFDGTGDWITSYNATLQSPATQRFGKVFTIEFWMYRTGTNANQWIVCSASGYDNAATLGGILIGYYPASGGDIAIAGGNLGAYWFGGGTINTNTWYHVAIVGTSSGCTIYIDGTSAATQAWPGAYSKFTTKGWVVGAGAQTDGNSPSNPFTGYINDLRITNGVARYTANFTPPTTAFPLL